MSRFDVGHIPIIESGEPLVLLESPEFVLEPKYFEQGISGSSEMYLREGTRDRLRSAQKMLPKGYRFKLWDCYRSRAVQQHLFELCKNRVQSDHPRWTPDQIFTEARKFIAIPDRADEVPPHNTGGTVDLTVVNERGEELDFGTGFDEFGDECYPFYYHESGSRGVGEDAIVRNRDMLFAAMQSAAFRLDSDEWWHFDYGNQWWALEFKKPHAIYGSAELLVPSRAALLPT